MRSKQHYELPIEWKSNKWFNSGDIDQRLCFLDPPRRVERWIDAAGKKYGHLTPDIKEGVNLLIYGTERSGKTALALWAAENAMHKYHVASRYLYAGDYVEMKKATFDSRDGLLPSDRYDSPYLLHWLREGWDILVLDNLTAPVTDYSCIETSNLIRKRFDAGKVTIVTTALQPARLKGLYNGLLSGFIDDCTRGDGMGKAINLDNLAPRKQGSPLGED